MGRISISLLAFGLLLAGTLAAQQNNVVQFEETVHDFGNIPELGGPVEHQFNFINNSSKPLVIRDVKASCGCTTPGWTRDTIPPGGTGYIQARYNPMGRPGAFNKSLSIATEPSVGMLRLFIRGNVDPKPSSIEDDFPVAMGDIRVKFRVFNVGRVKLRNEIVTRSFPVYNQGDSLLRIIKYVGPEHITLRLEPEQLSPGSAGTFVVTYDAMAKNDYGFQNENLTFWTNEPGEAARKSFSVYTNIEEYFAPMSQQELESSPVLSFDKDEHDFGRVKKDTLLETSFMLGNDGKEELLIRKVETNCSCVLTEIEGSTIMPGDSLELKVSFDTTQRRSNQQKSITIYANSPLKPVSRLIVKAYVEQN